jgi:hypothetical protein
MLLIVRFEVNCCLTRVGRDQKPQQTEEEELEAKAMAKCSCRCTVM